MYIIYQEKKHKLTFDFNCLLHLWISQEHTFVLSSRTVGDLLQTMKEKLSGIYEHEHHYFLKSAELAFSRW